MSETEWDDRARGKEPGSDVGDDGDVPDDPVLGSVFAGEKAVEVDVRDVRGPEEERGEDEPA